MKIQILIVLVVMVSFISVNGGGGKRRLKAKKSRLKAYSQDGAEAIPQRLQGKKFQLYSGVENRHRLSANENAQDTPLHKDKFIKEVDEFYLPQKPPLTEEQIRDLLKPKKKKKNQPKADESPLKPPLTENQIRDLLPKKKKKDRPKAGESPQKPPLTEKQIRDKRRPKKKKKDRPKTGESLKAVTGDQFEASNQEFPLDEFDDGGYNGGNGGGSGGFFPKEGNLPVPGTSKLCLMSPVPATEYCFATQFIPYSPKGSRYSG